MKVILLKEVKGRGGEGDVIDVKDGFANNHLIKDGYAVKATKGALRQLEERRKNIDKREEVRLAEANELKEKINNLKFKVDVQIGDEGQLFGSVTTQMIADGIKKNADVEIDKRRIDIRRAIRTVGLHHAEVTIYRDIKANIEVIVGDEDAEKFLEKLKAKKDKKSNPRGGKKPAKKPVNKGDNKDEIKNEDKPEEAKPEEKLTEPKAEEVKAEESKVEYASNEEIAEEEAKPEDNA